jgi:lipoprotein-anchoring transpeptidase ErfK/SrfK
VVKVMAAALVAGCIPVAVILALTPGPSPRPHQRQVAASPAAPRPAAVAVSKPAPASGYIVSSSTPIRYSERAGGPPVGTLPARNPYGQRQTVAVVGRPEGGWTQVELPLRPNGQTGWVPLSQVSLTRTAYTVSVDLETRTVTVRDAGVVVLSTPAAVGAPVSYTPKGHTFVWESIKPQPTGGPYGPYVLGLAEFSDTYATFNGGVAQIGIHGTDEPWLIGQAVSHGCVRVANQAIVEMVAMLPLGTPVTVY